LWGIDEALVSYQIDKWFRRKYFLYNYLFIMFYSNNNIPVGEYKYIRRIARENWDTYDFSKLNLSNYDDAHIIYETHLDKNWTKIRPLLELIFADDTKSLNFLVEYQKHVNSLLR